MLGCGARARAGSLSESSRLFEGLETDLDRARARDFESEYTERAQAFMRGRVEAFEKVNERHDRTLERVSRESQVLKRVTRQSLKRESQERQREK